MDDLGLNLKLTVRKFRWRKGVPLWLRTVLRWCCMRELTEGDDFDHVALELSVGRKAA